jgi:hypothetical protein
MSSQVSEDGESSGKPAPIPFSGVVDAIVIHDLHSLFRKRVLVLERLMLVFGLIGVPVSVWLTWRAWQAGDIPATADSLVTLCAALIMAAAFFELRRGWARHLTGQEISGGIHAAGVVVEQLDDRAAWSEFKSAWVGETTALLFTADAPHVPRVLSLDGLPLHRSFFESEREWMRVRQMILERITDIRMVGL